jgi:hypothetical protein
VIVVPANAVRGVLANPVDAGPGFRPVIDQIADAYTNVERLTDRFERGPVAVNVRKHQNTHAAASCRQL